MKTLRGDLLQLALDGAFDVIVHGCNCQCEMGAGIALGIRKLFPEAWFADRATARGNAAKLGTLSWAEIVRGARRFVVVNAYTQFPWSGRGVVADYAAIRSAMRDVKARFSGRRIGYPKIGAGSAHGDWSVIAAIIDEELAGEDHTCVEYLGPGSGNIRLTT